MKDSDDSSEEEDEMPAGMGQPDLSQVTESDTPQLAVPTLMPFLRMISDDGADGKRNGSCGFGRFGR